jgi:ParB/RepB/Spo0J family partition protein
MAQPTNGNLIAEIPLDRIRRDEGQARKDFDPRKLDEMVASIRTVGVLEPLELRPDPGAPGHFIIVYGERRWRAAQTAGLATVPAIVREPRFIRRRQLHENTMRVDLNAVELAENVANLMQEEGLDTSAVAEQLRWPVRKVQRLVEIHEAPDVVKAAIVVGIDVAGERRMLAPSHALDVVRAYRHFAKADESPTNENALRRTEKLVQRVVVEEWPAKRLQDFVAALGRGKRIRESDLEVVLSPPAKPARVDGAGARRSVVEPVREVAPPAASSARPAPALFDRSERRFVLHLERARACTEPVLRREVASALRELADEFTA